MSPIPLRIVLHGLIALTPANGADSANHMTALLVAAQTRPAEVDERCFDPHMPMLEVRSDQCTSVPGCHLDGLKCHCSLSRQDLSLLVDPPLDLGPLALGDEPHILPFDQSEAGSFSYVANLKRLGQTLDPRFLATVPPDALAARMTFPVESVKACALAVRLDEGSRNVHPLGFRLLGFLEATDDITQALAQQVLAGLTIPDQATVQIKVRDFGSIEEHLLTLQPEDGVYEIDLSNMRMTDMGVDDPCDDGIGRDFGFFYELVQNKPGWPDRKLPHVKYTHWKSALDLDPNECKEIRDHAPSSRPICPMASF